MARKTPQTARQRMAVRSRRVGSQVRSASQGHLKGKRKSPLSRMRTSLWDGLTGRNHPRPNLGFPTSPAGTGRASDYSRRRQRAHTQAPATPKPAVAKPTFSYSPRSHNTITNPSKKVKPPTYRG